MTAIHEVGTMRYAIARPTAGNPAPAASAAALPAA